MDKCFSAVVLINLSILVLLVSSESSLNHRLKNFELVEAERISKRRVKRGAHKADAANYNQIDEVQFKAFQRNFRLVLTPKRGLLSPDFKAHSYDYIDDYSTAFRKTPIYLNENEFLEGHLHGDEWSRVSAHFDENGALSALVETNDHTYVFEPAWRHLEGVSGNTTLVYRDSDLILSDQLKSLSSEYCGHSFNDSLPLVAHILNANGEKIRRYKRQSTNPPDTDLTRCPLKIVADYKFHSKIGNGNIATTTRYLINAIDRINTIFLNTIWQDSPSDPGITGLGFSVKEVKIMPQYSRRPFKDGAHFHYNMESRDRKWQVNQLLNNFSFAEGANYDDFCLAHLFTYQAFEGGVLGLGFIASEAIGGYGTVITREADIVTAHELGHNWGSVHDQPECTPSANEGGAYIMNTYSVSGFDPNNKKFSPCSKRSIKKVLLAKKDYCFTNVVAKFCGNQRIELDEQCDIGIQDRIDKCCDNKCKLTAGSQCSPINHECCEKNCMFSSRNTKCREENRNECMAASYCRGNSSSCPEPRVLRDGTTCLGDGECRNGICVSFCEKISIGKKPCICPTVGESCYRCCREEGSNVCRPYKKYPHEPNIILSAGTRCLNGFCDNNGACIKSSQDFITHFWNIITKLDGSNFTKFMRDNLVMTVVIISLLVWIPLSCAVHQIDKRREREIEEEDNWRASNSLVAESDRIEVVPGIRYIPQPYRPTNYYMQSQM